MGQVLTVYQIGLVVFCTLMSITFKRHGGVHGWDLTLPESYEAIYVSGSDLLRLLAYCLFLVVQCYIHRIQSRDPLYEAYSSVTLSSSVSSTPLEFIRYHSPSIYGDLLYILYRHYPG